MSKYDFMEECKDWLGPKGYTVHNHSADGNSVTLISDDPISPTITCTNRSGEKECRLHDSQYALFLTLSSAPLMFKHPDIDKWIGVFRYYTFMTKDARPPL